MKKREDLQGIRGIAISSVILFHFFPDTFKNGYVGVDQFFILSGFLMAEILSRDSSLTISGLQAFYYRRMKRILPLYVIFILFTLAIMLMFFPFPYFTYNISFALRSLAFTSNTNTQNDGPTYEELLADAQVLFAHTWSLSCEVQFYIIAPFLLLIPATDYKTIVLTIVGIVSYVMFTLFMEYKMQDIAFNFMITRIWQFALGSLFSVKTRKDSTSIEYKPLLTEEKEFGYEDQLKQSNNDSIMIFSNLTCISLFLLCWFPVEITSHFVRLVVCIQTAGLIYSGQNVPNSLLSNSWLVYLGDISYSLYLIHWPVCVFLKHYQYSSLLVLFLAIAFCIVLAAIVYETYEKFYLKLEKPGIIGLTSSLYISCIILILIVFPESIIPQKKIVIDYLEYIDVPANVSIEMAIELNTNYTIFDGTGGISECNYETPDSNMCIFNDTDFSGSKRILLIGNSYAGNLARMFIRLEECQQKAREIIMYKLYGCEVLENTGAWANHCINKTEEFQEVVANVKPDVLFISTRQMTSMMPVEGFEDTIQKTEKENLKRMEENVKEKVYILNAIPRQYADITRTINYDLKHGRKIPQDSLWEKSADYMLARKRMELLSKDCSKCEIIDVMPALTKNGIFQFYNEDNGVEYFVSSMHFSDYGLHKIAPIYRDICNNIY